MALFGNLSEKLTQLTDSFRGKTKVTAKDWKAIQREIKMALLEADVNFKVVKEIMADIEDQAQGVEVLESLTPGQQIIKILNDSLVRILGTDESKISFRSDNFTVLMLCGLQGSGKTTVAAKLAKMLKKQGKKPFLISLDVHRPAAQEQLRVLAESIDVPVYIEPEEKDAVALAKRGLEKARYMMANVVILDTAGRMTVDDDLMAELSEINDLAKPDEKYLVLDAMIGQEAVNIATEFIDKVGVDAFIMTKLDGDARGGAALSLRKVTGIPLKFIGTGEKIDDFEPFIPERMASRILGMGDVLTLIEKAEEHIDEAEAAKSFRKLQDNRFTLQDMLNQFEQVSKMGSFKDLLNFIPGLSGRINEEEQEAGEKAMRKNIAIIRAMTPEERNNYKILNGSRRKRIAQGSACSVVEVNQLIRQYEMTMNVMQQVMGKKKGRKKGKMSMKRMQKMMGDGNIPE